MSTRPPLTPVEAEHAADFALGQLSGADHAAARRLMRDHPGFRAEVQRWSSMLAPLVDEVEPRDPPPGLYDRIAERLGPAAANDNRLQAALRRWQWIGGSMSALAACLAVVLVATLRSPSALPPPPTRVTTPAPAPQPPMIATIAGDGPGRMIAVWNGGERSLTVAAASPLPGDPGHAHQLWLILADGTPRSMGVMPEGDMHAVLPDTMAASIADGVMLAISLEPAGGSPTGLPTGPVLARGTLRAT